MGKMIASYLDSKSELDDSAVHLLFSANRWEKRFVRATILNFLLSA
jgi:dTMP kinase